MAKGKYQRWLEPEGLTLLEDWARRGLTDEQIAHNMGCAAGTLYEWKNRYPEISEALKKGKEIVDAQVENALLKRALGYEYQEQRVEVSEEKGRKVVQTIRHVPPDTTAQIFWLKNRRPDRWRDRPEPPPARGAAENNLFEQMEASLDALQEPEPEAAGRPAVVADAGLEGP